MDAAVVAGVDIHGQQIHANLHTPRAHTSMPPRRRSCINAPLVSTWRCGMRYTQGYTPWLQAIQRQCLPLVQALLPHVDVNAALDDIPDCAYAHAFGVDTVFSAPCSPFEAPSWLTSAMQWPASYRYRHGMTPLMLACLSNNLSMVQMLLSCSTLDLNAADNIGHTALLYSTSDDAVLRLCTDARLDVTRHHSTQGTAIEVVGRRGNKPATIVVLQRLLGARHRNLPPDAVGAIATFFVYAPGMGSHPGFPVIELFAPNPNEIWEDQIDSILSFLP